MLFLYSNLNYCLLVWNFTSANTSNKIASVQKRALRFLFGDCQISYETLLMKAKKPTMMVQRLGSLLQKYVEQKMTWIQAIWKMSLKSQILLGRNERNTKIISLCPDQIITNLAQKVLLLLVQKFGILFLLILRP